MPSPNNDAPTWASQDQDSDDQTLDPPVHNKKPTSVSAADVQEELDALAASSAVGSPTSPVKPLHPDRPPPIATAVVTETQKEMEVETDELDTDDAAAAAAAAELARNQAAEALSDLANAAVALSAASSTTPALPVPSIRPVKREIAESIAAAAPVATTKPPPALTKQQKRRPAALLTPTRQSGSPGTGTGSSGSSKLNRSPNRQPAASAYRSPLVPSSNNNNNNNNDSPSGGSASSSAIITGVGLGSVKTEDLQARTSGNGTGGGSSARSAFNSPFTNQPFASTTANDTATTAGGVPVINTGTRKDVPTYHVLRKEDGEMCTRADLQYDFLHHLFSSPIQAFSIPAFQDVPRKYNPATRPKLTFSELYCYTLASSKRSTKQLKEALLDLEPGAIPGKHQAGKAYRTRKRGELSKSGTAGTDSVNASPGPDGQMVDELMRDEQLPADELMLGGASTGGDPTTTTTATTSTTTVDGYDGLRDSYAKICLLVNVGRINTTFAFYPAMRTVLRTYHSVPSLQKTLATRKSLQDAPRMKNALKAIRVATEPDDVELPGSLSEVLDRLHAGDVPPTSVVNLIFLLGLGHETVTETFFTPGNIVDRHNLLAARATQSGGSVNENGKLHILNLFTVINIPSTERARMFLYILYHYLESDTGPNPFADPDRPGEPPLLHVLNDEEYASLGENIDEQDELEWGAEMRARRIESLKELALQKQSALNTPGAGALYAFNTTTAPASAATSARNSIEPSSMVFPYRPNAGNESVDANSDRHSDVGTDVSSRKRKRYSPLALESTLSAATARSLRAGGAAASRPSSRQVSPESVRILPPSHEALASEAPSARGSPHDTHYDSRFPSRSQSQSRSHRALPDQDISDYEDDVPKTVILGRRDRNDPRAMQDDWAHGVDISGLDEETVRLLIHQVNLEFGDPPAPEPEIIWKESEKGPSSYDEQRRIMDEDFYARQDSRRISYGNGHAEGRPLISPSRESKRVGDVRSVQSSHSPAFSHREPQQERHPSVNNGLAPSTSMDRLPASPPARKTNSLSALLN